MGRAGKAEAMNRLSLAILFAVAFVLAAGCDNSGPGKPPQPGGKPGSIGWGQSVNNLKQIALAMHNFHAANNRFPPAVLMGPDGKTPHSWRVALLPYLEQGNLYRQYRLDEPWDGPNNRQLLAKLPAIYRAPRELPGSSNASYFVLTGPETIFDGPQGSGMADIRDGTSNTLLVVECKRDIPWTKPEDIPYDPRKPLPELGGCYEDLFIAAMADGSVRALPKTTDEQTLRALISKAGGEVVGPLPGLNP